MVLGDQRADWATFAALLGASPVPCWIYDPVTLRILAANETFFAVYGRTREELPRLTLLDLRGPEEQSRLRALLDAPLRAPAVTGPWLHQRRDGSVLAVEISSHPIHFEGVDARLAHAFDVTAREQALREAGVAQQQLLRSQKMETLAVLSSGLAHDFNNLLTGILGYVALVDDALPPENFEAKEDLAAVADAARRAAAVTRRLLTFARRQAGEAVLVDANTQVLELDKLLRRLLGAHIDLVVVPVDGLGPVFVDPGALEQVVMNLVVNARDAMPGGGRLAIQLQERLLGAGDEGGLSAGVFIELSVSDTGCGMAPDVLSRLFEPFFSTKEPGRGTGLGLASAHAIVQAAKGAIRVESTLGVGTTVRVLLPRADVSEHSDAKIAGPPRGHETVLLVEDEAMLRELSTRTLRSFGYRVLPAASGGEALEVEAAHAGEIQVLITDLVMPGMSGRQVAAELARRRPHVRTLFVSGYADDGGGGEVLLKPFTAVTLARRLREVLR